MRVVLIIFAALIAVVVGLGLLVEKTFRAEVVIPAPPEAVWTVLMDTAAYGDWNPVFVGVDGAYTEGGDVLNHVAFPGGEIVEINAQVDTVTPNEALRQSGGVPLVLTFDHQWLLEPVDGGTRVTQYEVDRGIYLLFWDSSWVEPAYADTNQALSERVAATRN